MIRLVINNTTLTGSVKLNTSGTIDDTIDKGVYTLTASRQLSLGSWADTTHSRLVTTMLFGGTGSSDDNGTVTFGGTATSWDFGESGLLGNWIKKDVDGNPQTPATPYIASINTNAPTAEGEITLCASDTVDVGIIPDAVFMTTTTEAGDLFPYSSLPSDQLLNDLNYSEVAGKAHILLSPTIHLCNPNAAYLAINKFIWYLYAAYNSLTARMLDWVFSNNGFSGFGIGLNTYKNYQAIVAFMNLYSWQQSFVLRASSSGTGVGIVFGFVESECHHSSVLMDLDISIVSADGGSDVAYRQPYAVYLTGIDTTLPDSQPTVQLKQLYQFGFVLDPGSASWTSVDGSGKSLHPKTNSGYDLFGGAKCSVNLGAVSVGQRYLLGIQIAPVSGGKRDWTADENYPTNETCVLLINGKWRVDGGCTYAKSVNAQIKALLAGTSSDDPGYVAVTSCTQCGIYEACPPYYDGPMGSLYGYKCKVVKYPINR